MKRQLIFILAAVILGASLDANVWAEPDAEAIEPADAAVTEEQPDAADSAAPDATSPSQTTGADDSPVARPGKLRETVTESMRLFTPSEEIDVDKPVDFPTNI
jgi:hypothetical protein